jgi:hypothetical protein
MFDWLGFGANNHWIAFADFDQLEIHLLAHSHSTGSFAVLRVLSHRRFAEIFGDETQIQIGENGHIEDSFG